MLEVTERLDYTPPQQNLLWEVPVNTFYHGDCLFVMRHDIPPDSIDLIYLDPPFFTGKVQKGTWRPEAMEISFDDSKRFWASKGVAEHAPDWLKSLAIELDRPDLASYLYYMMVRLDACRSVLNAHGSIYLHCDPRVSHYMKMVMDRVFGLDRFINEIIWYYESGGRSTHYYPKKHDVILWYSKGPKYHFDWRKSGVPRGVCPLCKNTLEKWNNLKREVDSDGRVFRTIRSAGKVYRYYDDDPTVPPDVWVGINHLQQKDPERTGYPTQKPEALLERIIDASCPENGIVLDPFCGCGTTVIAASKLNREWIGIDIDTSPREKGQLPTAFQVISNRAHLLFQQARYITRDLSEVKEMDGYAFERWTNEILKATKPSPDMGVDGVTKEGTPIQSKVFQIKRDVLSQFVTDAKFHPQVPKPLREVVVVSQTGFDDSARRRKFEIETTEGIKVILTTPEELLMLEE